MGLSGPAEPDGSKAPADAWSSFFSSSENVVISKYQASLLVLDAIARRRTVPEATYSAGVSNLEHEAENIQGQHERFEKWRNQRVLLVSLATPRKFEFFTRQI